MPARRTSKPFTEELPRLLEERGLSVRAFARMVGVNQAHLSRVLRQKDYRRVSGDLARRAAETLDLEPDYFAEYREAVVVKRVKEDGAYRDQLYTEIKVFEKRR